jgi:hypothetical protein
LTEIPKCLEKIVFYEFSNKLYFCIFFANFDESYPVAPNNSLWTPHSPPIAFNGPTMAPYGNICHSMAPYVTLWPHIWAPYVLLWAPYDHFRALSDTSLTLYASLWAPYKTLRLNMAPYCPNGLHISPV